MHFGWIAHFAAPQLAAGIQLVLTRHFKTMDILICKM
jgi:hypothetical protein